MKELITKNKVAATVLSDICHGNGRTLVDGMMVPTGACKSELNKKGHEIVNLDGANDIHYKCKMRDTV